ncbi:MAG: OmpA family protein [Bacteroidota bacterium]
MRIFITIIISTIYINSFGQENIFNTSKVNSFADEQIPLISADGKTMFFTRGHHPENAGGKPDKGDVWFSQLSDTAGWSTPQKLDVSVNDKFYNGAFAYTGRNLYLYGNYRSGLSPVPGISVSKSSQSGDWGEAFPVRIQYFQNKSANNGNALSLDGSIMIMSLESYKSKGAEDLYVTFWSASDNSWSEPRNLGAQINTPMQELTPYLSPDNKTLFFASNGHPGHGSRDIFVSQRLDDTWTNWSPPRNLGEEVNTEGAEMGYRYYPDKEIAIFTSTKNSDGYGDIIIIPVKNEALDSLLEEKIVVPEEPIAIAEPVQEEVEATPVIVVEEPEPEPEIVEETPVVEDNQVILSGNVTDTKTNEAVFARFKVKGKSGQEYEHFNDTTFSFILERGNKYIFQIDAEGYISKQMDVATGADDPETMILNVALEPISIGATVKLDNVLFKRGTTDLLESSNDELDLVVEMMKNNPTMEIELSGHTDNVGIPSLNVKLSQERVDAVIVYLAGHGIDKSRLSGKGYGGSKPIASNRSESTRRLNRRVEFTILKQ